MDEIFGPKMHKDFFQKFMPPGSCGNGFYVTRGEGDYPPGVALVGDSDVASLNKKVTEPTSNTCIYSKGSPEIYSTCSTVRVCTTTSTRNRLLAPLMPTFMQRISHSRTNTRTHNCIHKV